MVLFEHEKLRVGTVRDGVEFTASHFDRISRWLDRTGHPGLEVRNRSIRATQWVGVLQVGTLILEILPKAEPRRHDATVDRKALVARWRRVLLEMLSALKGFPLRTSERASIRLQSHSLLDLFYEAFTIEADKLLREGLVKTYRHVARNRTAWRGRWIVGEDLSRNMTRRERVFTEALEYDCSNSWNRILAAALEQVANRADEARIRIKAGALLLPLQDAGIDGMQRGDFECLPYDRRTERYRTAMELARLILHRESPDLQAGREDVFALLFDMNVLWEAWVAETLRRALKGTPHRVTTQVGKAFWRGGDSTIRVRPDIVINGDEGEVLPPVPGFPALKGHTVLDTKWKVLDSARPAASDLQQMFVYNQLWGAQTSWLIYPEVNPDIQGVRGSFSQGGTHCGVAFVPLPLDCRNR